MSETNLSFPNPGGRPSKPDYRARIIAAAVSAAPQAVLPTKYLTDWTKLGGPLDQKKTPACVSHAMAQLMKLWWFTKTGEVVNFSPRFLHALSVFPGSTPEDGRNPMDVAKVAYNFGCATEATCPNDTTLDNATYMNLPITDAMKAEAAKYKIPGYVTLPVTQNDFRQAVYKYGAISMLMRIGPEWWTDKNGNQTWDQALIDPLRAPNNYVVGGHQLVGNGFDAALDHLLNSWSPQWAENGSSDYLWNEWNPFIVEGLVISDIPGAALAQVQSLPSPTEFKHNFATTISLGQTNDEVRALQIALAIDGENTYPVITGFYGPITRAAVAAFQAKYGINNSGTAGSIAGPLTRSKLNQIFNHG